MREILFRGKRVNNGEWVYGYLCDCFDFKGVYHLAIQEFECAPKNEVNPETVGQYTGLNDKNGKKIFEGDIVKVQGRSTLYCEVTYGKSSAMYWIGNDKLEYYAELGAINLRYLEIVGNVIDNPELIGKSEQLEK